ncbi:MAG: amidase family protein [Rhodobacteraceae bacterium]|nr:amidase family protein [Paracoccaceae bacterium]
MAQIWQLSASEIANSVRNKKLSAVEVTMAHLERLDAVNGALNAVVQEFPDEALAEAQKVDDGIAHGEEPGPLCGVPVTIKVNTDQTGHANTNGLVILKDVIAKGDSPVVSNIRKAGGVIVGRTNTPAFSLRWFTNNNLHGHTYNPRDKSLTPGGSSGGAASAVASGICAIGHGTDIGGSIRYPAYACGVHGLRPTLGRIPAWNASGGERHIGGQIMAVSGPIARTIADIRLGLEAMMAQDPRDPWWVPVPLDLGEVPKRAALCVAPEGLVIADEVEKALRDAAVRLKSEGWSVEEVDCPPFREPAALNAQLWMAEMRRAAIPAIKAEAEEASTFVFEHMAARSAPIDIDGLLDALQSRATFVREWQVFMQKYPVLICPVSAELPFRDQQDVESNEGFEAIMEAQLTQLGLPLLGLPGLSVATGMVGKVPVGVQLVAGRYREDVLLDAGAVIERGGMPVSPVDPG